MGMLSQYSSRCLSSIALTDVDFSLPLVVKKVCFESLNHSPVLEPEELTLLGSLIQLISYDPDDEK